MMNVCLFSRLFFLTLFPPFSLLSPLFLHSGLPLRNLFLNITKTEMTLYLIFFLSHFFLFLKLLYFPIHFPYTLILNFCRTFILCPSSPFPSPMLLPYWLFRTESISGQEGKRKGRKGKTHGALLFHPNTLKLLSTC